MQDRYGQFCPIAKAMDVVGGRWTLLILRELFAGSRRFSELQRGLSLISRSLLTQRLKQMEEDGLITATEKANSRGFDYGLTESGAALAPVLDALCAWGLRFAEGRITPEDCEPTQMMWMVRRYADQAALPAWRFVVRFEFRNLPPSRRAMTTWWLIWDRGAFDHCLDNPGFDVDVVVNCFIDVFVRVWLGGIGLDDAERSGAIRFEGTSTARDAFIRMLDFRRTPCTKVYRFGPASDMLSPSHPIAEAHLA